MSYNARTLDFFRKRGWIAQMVEQWNAWSKRRRDLWGFDLVAIHTNVRGTVWVQFTSRGNIADRIKKLRALETTRVLMRADNPIFVMGWSQDPRSKRWGCKIVELFPYCEDVIYESRTGHESITPPWTNTLALPGRDLELGLPETRRRRKR